MYKCVCICTYEGLFAIGQNQFMNFSRTEDKQTNPTIVSVYTTSQLKDSRPLFTSCLHLVSQILWCLHFYGVYIFTHTFTYNMRECVFVCVYRCACVYRCVRVCIGVCVCV